MPDIETIHPVITPVAAADRLIKGREKVALLRRDAREALAISARFSNCALGPLEKDKNGAPIPFGGIHWSLSHKSTYVAAVVARKPIGIDIERINPVTKGVENRIAGPREWGLAPCRDLNLFFRYWTAKEAVLKSIGIGLSGLDDCRIQQILDDRRLLVNYQGQCWTVTHHWIGQEHLAAITSDDVAIEWHVTL